MADQEGVQPDTREVPVAPSMVGKPDDWPDVTRAAMRQEIERRCYDLRVGLQDATAAVGHGLADEDIVVLVTGLRKLVASGVGAKALADELVTWYGLE